MVEIYRFLNAKKKKLFFEETVRIDPAISLFIIAHPTCDAIVRK